ncbi:MAG: class I SAM-dependent methyltransferase [Hyphomicrobiales bacterium]
MCKKTQTNDYASANLAAWEQVAPIHAQHNHARLLQSFSKPAFSCLDEIETGILNRLGVNEKDVAQVCCNNGQELLSVKNMGAARCVGFDGARGFIDQAQELALAADQAVEFVCCDAYDIPEAYHASFDLVTITIGVLGWMPDIDGFFSNIEKLLKPGGAIFIYEHHPIIIMIKPAQAEEPIEWELSYFRTMPYIDKGGLDYFGGEEYDAKPTMSFSHKLSDIIMAAVKTELAIESFEELPHHISNAWWNVEKSDLGLPMCFTLILRKAP